MEKDPIDLESFGETARLP